MTSTQIAADIDAERKRQDAKWGEQNHSPSVWLAVISEELGEASEAFLQWYFGGLSKEQFAHFREELVHVAAVSIAAIESLDRQKSRQ